MTVEMEQYFKTPGAPAKGSPVGELMQRIVAKNPGMSFDAAREEAKAMLYKAAGRFEYRIPRVMSPEQKEKERLRLKTAFRTLPKAA
jgi:hypothetical protein